MNEREREDRRKGSRREEDPSVHEMAGELKSFKEFMSRTERSLQSIEQSLRTLTELNVKHDHLAQAVERAFETIGGKEERLRKVELQVQTFEAVFNGVADRELRLRKVEGKLGLVDDRVNTLRWVASSALGAAILVLIEALARLLGITK